MADKVKVIVKFKTKLTEANMNFVTDVGAQVKDVYPSINAVSMEVPKNKIGALQLNEDIEYVEMDGTANILGFPSTTVLPKAEQIPWGVAKIRAPEVHATGNKGTGIKVCIIDTGIDYNHEDLKSNYKGGYNFLNNTTDPLDDQGHGTHVAGTVAAVGNNNLGVVGIAPEAGIYSCKALDSNGSGSYSNIVAAIQWAIDNKMQIISMSLGGSSANKALEDICNAAYNAGIIILAAAGNSDGNEGQDTVGYPAKYEACMAVAATDINDARASFSSVGPKVEIAAPGVNVLSTVPKSGTTISDPSGYKQLNGTCLTGDSLILLDDKTPVNIEDIVEGDCVFSYDNEKIVKNKVKKVIENGKKKVYLLRLKGRYIKCTDNHPFLAKSELESEYVWKELKDIKIGDNVLCLHNLPLEIQEFDAPNFSEIIEDIYSDLYFKLTEKGRDKIISDVYWYTNLRTRDYFKKQTTYTEGTVRGLVRLRNGMKFKEISKLFNFLNKKLESDDYVLSNRSNASEQNIRLPTMPDSKFCMLFGYLTGNGWLSHNRNDRIGNNYQTSLAIGYIGEDIKEHQEKYISLFEEIFNIDLTWYSEKLYFCYSKIIHEYLKRLGLYKYATEKDIPDWVFKLNPKLKKDFINGLLDADGHKYDSSSILEMGSKKLIDKLIILCSEIGIHVSNVTSREREYKFFRDNGKLDIGVGKCYGISISDKNFGINFKGYKVKNIEYLGEEYTFDIEIENSHNFIANGIIVHNSMATPHMAGVSALIIRIHPDWTSVQIRDAIDKGCVDLGKTGRDVLFGYGRTDAMLATGGETPPQKKYACSGAPNYQCTENSNGPYNTIEECQAQCIEISPPPKKYSCNNGTCVEDPNGNFPDLVTCQKICTTPPPPPIVSKFRVHKLGNLGVAVLKTRTGDKTAEQACQYVCNILKKM